MAFNADECDCLYILMFSILQKDLEVVYIPEDGNGNAETLRASSMWSLCCEQSEMSLSAVQHHH